MSRDEMMAKMVWCGVKQKMGGLAGIVDNPMSRLALRYWWMAAPVGLAAWTMYRNRKAKGEVNVANILTDLGTILGPVVSIAILLEFSKKEESKIMAGGQVKDAQFTPVPNSGATP
jgi:hypothetical protein